MTILSKERIELQKTITNRDDAIRRTGRLLVETDCVAPLYVEGMLAREQSMSTSLGNGIAIPHGMYEDRAHVFKTGISILQIPGGVDWGGGDWVKLVIGIAATSEEHLVVLRNLSVIVENKKMLSELFSTNEPEVILEYLSDSGAG